MTEYYFIILTAEYPSGGMKFDRSLVRCEELSSRSKAESRRQEIEREINNGHLWTIEDAMNKTFRRKVQAIPLGEARCYTDFSSWPCNEES